MKRVSGWVVVGIVLFSSKGAFAQAAGSFPDDTQPAAAPPTAPQQPPAAPQQPPAAPQQPPAAAAPSPGETPAPAAAPAPEAQPPAAPPPPEPPRPAPRAEVYEPPPPDEASESKPVDNRKVSLTFSPLHLLIGPVFEMQVEAQLTPHFGAALIGGIGTVKVEDDINGKTSLSAYELGGQLVAYPLADFKSLQLGAEVLWVKVSTEEVNGRQIHADAAGVAFGPFIGYKLITSAGFTFFAQGGFEYLTARGEASDDDGNSDSDEESTFLPLLNLNIGWSF